MFEIAFEGYRVMCHCRPQIQRAHNIRDSRIVKTEKHIDLTRPHEVILDLGTMEQSYEIIFGEAVKRYNAKQKRKDRHIKNYMLKVLNDSREGKHKNLKADGHKKLAYEMIIQIGNRDNQPDSAKATKILKDFCTYIQEKYPNIAPIGIYLHNDEFSLDEETGKRIYSPPHLHFDFIYVAHLGVSLKTGMELQNSMSGALAEMGFVTSKGKGTAQAQFEEAVRHDLQDFAEARGLTIDRTLGKKHRHQDKDMYQMKKDTAKRSERLKSKERKVDAFVSIVNQKMADISSKEYNLNQDRKNFEMQKELFDLNTRKIQSYRRTTEDVEVNEHAIDKEVNRLKASNSSSLASRLSVFITNVKRIVTKAVTELHAYKFAFQRFWKFGA